MSSDQIIALLVAIVAGAGASIVTGFFGMPKLLAEAKHSKTSGETTISGDAREWAKTFAERADKAVARADAAEERADEAEVRAEKAERHANELDTRCDEIESRYLRLAAYTRTLQTEMKSHGWTPPEPPSDLIPPL